MRIKLSADGSQVREELRLIDKEAKRIGASTGGSRGSSSKGGGTSTSGDDSQHERLLGQISDELKLVRKELQRFNGSGSSGGATATSSVPRNSSSSSSSAPTTPKSNDSSGSEFSKAAGKIVAAISALNIVGNAASYVNQGAYSARDAKLQAYKTYSTTGAYSDYKVASEAQYNIGHTYAYNSRDVMNAAEANMSSGAGYTNIGNYNTDMASIMSTSRAWGLDANKVASSVGNATALGITQSGSQDRYLELMASSIEKSGMIGREEEQLDVLNNIASTLGNVNTHVTEQGFNKALGLSNTLSEMDSGLKGSRGANVVDKMINAATSDDSTLNVLAGFGTEYTGLTGKQQLRRMAEDDPVAYWQKVYAGAQQYGVGEDYFKELLYQKLGNQNESDTVYEALKNGTLDESDFGGGAAATQEQLSTWNGSEVQREQQYETDKQQTQENFGEGLNDVLNPFKGLYSGLSPQGQGVATIATGVAGLGASALLGKGAKSFIDSILKGSGGGSKLGDILAGVTGKASGTAAEGAAKAAGSSIDDILGAAGKAVGGAGGILGKAGGALGKVGGFALKRAPIIGTVASLIGTGIDVKSNLDAGQDREAAKAAGSGVGGLAGAAGGAAAGAAIGAGFAGVGAIPGAVIGGVIGGLGLGLAGDAAGGAAGGAIYDAATGSNDANSSEIAASTQNTSDATDEISKHVANIDQYLSGGKSSSDAGWVSDKSSGSGTSLSSISRGSRGNSIDSTKSYISTTNKSDSTSGSTSGGGWLSGLSSIVGSIFGTGHAVGADYIPYDNYPASLHRGEMVLTKMEADDYRRGKAGGNAVTSGALDLNININGNVEGMNQSNQQQIVNAVIAQVQASNLQSMLSGGFTRVQNY